MEFRGSKYNNFNDIEEILVIFNELLWEEGLDYNYVMSRMEVIGIFAMHQSSEVTDIVSHAVRDFFRDRLTHSRIMYYHNLLSSKLPAWWVEEMWKTQDRKKEEGESTPEREIINTIDQLFLGTLESGHTYTHTWTPQCNITMPDFSFSVELRERIKLRFSDSLLDIDST